MKKLMFVSFTCAALIFATSCGSSSNSNDNSGQTEATSSDDSDMSGMDMSGDENDSAADNTSNADVQVSNTISITGNDQMKFDATLFKVKAGQPVTLTLKNVGTMPATASSHDVVVLKAGSDVSAFGQAAAQDKSGDHIPASKSDEVIAHTKMLGPGESDKITFTLPAAGEYPFLCSFPGHFMSMQGKIIAE